MTSMNIHEKSSMHHKIGLERFNDSLSAYSNIWPKPSKNYMFRNWLTGLILLTDGQELQYKELEATSNVFFDNDLPLMFYVFKVAIPKE